MSETLHVVLPGDPATRTGGFVYDARMIESLRAAGRRVTVHVLPADFPFPTEATLAAAESLLAGLPEGAAVVVDGLGLGALPASAGRHAPRLRLVALVHHPLAAETGLTEAQAAGLFESERAALACCRGVLVTSRHSAAALAAYSVPPARIRVAQPGVDAAPLARGSGDGTPSLLCVATLTPRKGHADLVAALSLLAERPWRLICAGSDRRDPATATALRRQVAEAGLSGRIEILGEVGDAALEAAYAAADLFVLASHYEGYGMVFLEALARGLPVVATAGGATAETLPAEAALLAPPGDPEKLAEVLARVLDDRALRARLAAGAARVRATLPDWQAAGARFATALDELLE